MAVWAARPRALYAADAPSPRKKVLVAVFQRGAADGLNVVVPFGEQSYYDLRPNLAIPKPDGTADSAAQPWTIDQRPQRRSLRVEEKQFDERGLVSKFRFLMEDLHRPPGFLSETGSFLKLLILSFEV